MIKWIAVLFLDLDNFKQVNDHFGHATGDLLLKRFSETLLSIIRPYDTPSSKSYVVDDDYVIARLAGDEFAIILRDAGSATAERIASEVVFCFEHGFDVDDVNHNVHVSIGIAMFPQDAGDERALLTYADAAMYEAKVNGKNGYRFFSREIGRQLTKRKVLEDLLATAVRDSAFEFMFLPIFANDNLKPLGMEVLLRCPALDACRVSTREFIKIAESNGLILKIDLFVIEAAFKQLSELKEKYDYRELLYINISSLELSNEKFPGAVFTLLREYEIDPKTVVFDITETFLANEDQTVLAVMNELNSVGIQLVIDGFGIGFSNLLQLKNYPVSGLKFDTSFVEALGKAKRGVQSDFSLLTELAQLHDLKVTAVGVETVEQLERVKELPCDHLQGHLLSQPLNKEEMVKWVRDLTQGDAKVVSLFD